MKFTTMTRHMPLLILILSIHLILWVLWMMTQFNRTNTFMISSSLNSQYNPSSSSSNNNNENNNKYSWVKNETLFQNWINTVYQAPKKEKQEYCKNILLTRSGSSSQFGQDLIIFFTLYQEWLVQGRKGYYVDSGTNDAIYISNTVFYDWCLGWDGLCIEPDTQYHENIRLHRSCTLIPECISNLDNQQVLFHFIGSSGHIAEEDNTTTTTTTTTTTCSTLQSMLQRVNKTTTTTITDSSSSSSSSSTTSSKMMIDFWSLDVEGHEMTVLKTIDFNKIQIDTLLIEDFWIPTRELDQFMYSFDFIKLYELPIDALYIHRSSSMSSSSIQQNKVWLPSTHLQNVDSNLNYRLQNKDKLQCI